MNPDRFNPQLEQDGSGFEKANEPKTALDKIRKWAHGKALIAAAVVGIAGAGGCGSESKETNVQNQNEVFQGCEPFSMCMTTGLYDNQTKERIGFSFWYKVPNELDLEEATFKVLGRNGNVIAEEIVTLIPGTNQFDVTKPGYPGDLEDPEAPLAGGIEINMPGQEPIVIKNRELDYE